MKSFNVENPKRFVASNKANAGWVDYYAGFSNSFAKTLLESSNLQRQAVIVDPWNGSGTTTEIASILGFKGFGFDINPVMLIISKARMLSKPTRPSIDPLLNRIIATSKRQAIQLNGVDSLGFWFKPSGIQAIRAVESAIQKLLIDSKVYRTLQERNIKEEISDLGAFFYNALFRSVRRQLGPFYSSNPTWIRRAKGEDQKICLDLNSLCTEFRWQVNGMLKALEDVPYCHLDADYVLDIASSEELPMEDESADMIFSSPPYCTRIDYAIATLPELAILGFSQERLRTLRDNIIGTSTISKTQPLPEETWGDSCINLLSSIQQHEAKASSTYYYKNHIQYFAAMAKSLAECGRILKKDGRCVLVVQDSYYKNIHNDLPEIIAQMASKQGLSLRRRVNFRQSRTMAGVHPGVKGYRKSFEATEAVLCFSRIV